MASPPIVRGKTRGPRAPGQTLLGRREVLGPAPVLSAAGDDPRFPVINILHLTRKSGAWLLLWQDLGSKDQEVVNWRLV